MIIVDERLLKVKGTVESIVMEALKERLERGLNVPKNYDIKMGFMYSRDIANSCHDGKNKFITLNALPMIAKRINFNIPKTNGFYENDYFSEKEISIPLDVLDEELRKNGKRYLLHEMDHLVFFDSKIYIRYLDLCSSAKISKNKSFEAFWYYNEVGSLLETRAFFYDTHDIEKIERRFYRYIDHVFLPNQIDLLLGSYEIDKETHDYVISYILEQAGLKPERPSVSFKDVDFKLTGDMFETIIYPWKEKMYNNGMEAIEAFNGTSPSAIIEADNTARSFREYIKILRSHSSGQHHSKT